MKLEWQIESDRYRDPEQHYKEDPEYRQQRNRRVGRILVTVVAMLSVIGTVIWFIDYRLKDADARIRTLLENTVQAEITALNLGEQVTFERIQRSATDDWLRTQAEIYMQYQADKVMTDRVLTGRIYNIEVDRQRGRVQVEEIENGTPYVRTWFYWNYDAVLDTDGNVVETSGWHHVAPDYTFWGAPGTIESERFVVRYQGLDEPFAIALVERLNAWYEILCSALDCGRLSFLTIDIVPDPMGRVRWQAGDAWQLVVPSPFTGRARYDEPFSGNIARDVATALAQQVVSASSLTGTAELDAQYLTDSVQRWLVGRWLGVDNGAYLIESIVQQYGAPGVSQVLAGVRSNSAISVVAQTLNIDLAVAALDWRDFLSWRLAVEERAAQRGDLQTLARLYEPTPSGQQLATQRLTTSQGSQTVVSITRETSPEGVPQLYAITADGATVIFRLYDQIWVRAA